MNIFRFYFAYITALLDSVHSRELKTQHQTFEIYGFHNKFMMLISTYRTTYITWLLFVFSFSNHLSRLLCDVTCYIIIV